MASSMVDEPMNGNDGSRWRRFGGRRVEMIVPEGRLVSRAEDLLRQADSIAATLEQMLKPEASERLTVYLVASDAERGAVPGLAPEDAPEGDTALRDAGQPLVITVDPDEITISLIGPVVRAMLARWYGPAVGGAR